MKTKKIYFIVICTFIYLAISNLNSFSQSKSADTLKPKNSLQKGAWAVQFGIDQDFTLTNFSGASFTIKRHFSKNIALRFGVGTTLAEYNQNVSYQFNSNFYSQNINGYQNDFNFNLLMLYYLNPDRDFNVYLLAGPVFSYGFTKNSLFDGFYRINQTSKNISFGGQAGFGAEYFVFRSFSIFAEYNASLVHSNYNNYANRDRENINSESSGTSFSFNNVRFGLSVYF